MQTRILKAALGMLISVYLMIGVAAGQAWL